MGGTSFSMNWSGLDRLVARGIAEIPRTQALAENIGEALVSNTQQRFEDQEGPDGTAWKQSAKAQGRSGQTLVESAQLRNSIGYEASPQRVVVGTNKVYARIHQLGGKAGRGHSVTLPARPYLGWSEADAEEVQQMIREYLATAFIG